MQLPLQTVGLCVTFQTRRREMEHFNCSTPLFGNLGLTTFLLSYYVSMANIYLVSAMKAEIFTLDIPYLRTGSPQRMCFGVLHMQCISCRTFLWDTAKASLRKWWKNTEKLCFYCFHSDCHYENFVYLLIQGRNINATVTFTKTLLEDYGWHRLTNCAAVPPATVTALRTNSSGVMARNNKDITFSCLIVQLPDQLTLYLSFLFSSAITLMQFRIGKCTGIPIVNW